MTDPTHAFSRRRLLTGAMAATTTALALGLTGCGDSGESKAAASIPSTGTDDGATITMWSRAPLEKQATNAVKAYNASHKNQVKLSLLPNDDVEGKVGAAVQTDSLPDILAGDVVRIPYWAQQGIFTDLTKNIDGLADKADLQTGHIKAGTVDGKEYTLPFGTDISVMVWNKDLYKEAGLNPEKGPTTIAEFLAHATAVAKLGKKDVAGSYLAGQSGGALVFTLLPSVWASGQKAISDDGTKSLLDNAAAKSVYEAYATLAKLSNGLGAGSKEETGATWTAPLPEREGRRDALPGHLGERPVQDLEVRDRRDPHPRRLRRVLDLPGRRCDRHQQGLQEARPGVELPGLAHDPEGSAERLRRQQRHRLQSQGPGERVHQGRPPDPDRQQDGAHRPDPDRHQLQRGLQRLRQSVAAPHPGRRVGRRLEGRQGQHRHHGRTRRLRGAVRIGPVAAVGSSPVPRPPPFRERHVL
ncbi:Solute-binding protein of ABC transporter system for sugars [Acidipropionibacterium acidipropionici ATCC 4875]|uniref:Solute-binding protein of ABC transporter system for sugars n=1 Tax=Acidipropionibacterium acidipropionici (strain ATCC 4875 / DSM 20272 / JCM 6432 / NBRC 12425 / NCIMB 8070 / 4) TaxID=1171373 RepID=K7S5L5_ACIA4|nr:Solute-binding protein of ABC transporter system for sugars [Acidipropionibacterium acidipropionici ATCC 4875]